MIFSTDRCPLCNEKLDLEVRDLTTDKGTKVVFIYTCKNTAPVYKKLDISHYRNECYLGGSLCQMTIPPYIIFHSESNDMTSVYECVVNWMSNKKLIFRTKLLDLDYSQPHLVVDKLKLLVTFS